MVNHFYFYAVDEDFGPFFLKFGTYFPYNAKLCLNGHEYVKRQLAQRGIGGAGYRDQLSVLQAEAEFSLTQVKVVSHRAYGYRTGWTYRAKIGEHLPRLRWAPSAVTLLGDQPFEGLGGRRDRYGTRNPSSRSLGRAALKLTHYPRSACALTAVVCRLRMPHTLTGF